MTDVVHAPILATGTTMRLRFTHAAARLRASIERWIVAVGTRRALAGLSDDLLRDNGLTRVDIPFVAEAVASGRGDVTLDPSDRVNRSAAGRSEVSPASWSERVITSRTFYI
jgi:uncharacterized protein YjiS (DUF1127 family)